MLEDDDTKDAKSRDKLVSGAEFKNALRKVLSTSKEESDRQLAEFQASNKARREQKKSKKD